jgi:hypothetical protein
MVMQKPVSDHFLPRATRASLPFLIWAVHFGFAYIVAASQCTPGAFRAEGPNPWILGGATLLSMAACVWAGALSGKRLRQGSEDFVDYVGAASAVLATVAVAWTGIPVLVASGCA